MFENNKTHQTLFEKWGWRNREWGKTYLKYTVYREKTGPRISVNRSQKKKYK
jgi:hypothetical protein